LDPLLGQRALSWSRGSFSITVLKDHSTRGIRHRNIKYAHKTKNVSPIKVLNQPKVENQPLNGSLFCIRIISMENQSFGNNTSCSCNVHTSHSPRPGGPQVESWPKKKIWKGLIISKGEMGYSSSSCLS
jgi:hypothetical protein